MTTCNWTPFHSFHYIIAFFGGAIVIFIIRQQRTFIINAIVTTINFFDNFDIQSFFEAFDSKYGIIKCISSGHVRYDCFIVKFKVAFQHFSKRRKYLRLLRVIHGKHFSLPTNESMDFGHSNQFFLIFIFNII